MLFGMFEQSKEHYLFMPVSAEKGWLYGNIILIKTIFRKN